MNNKGFIATSILYTFFIVFLALLAVILNNYLISNNIKKRYSENLEFKPTNRINAVYSIGNGILQINVVSDKTGYSVYFYDGLYNDSNLSSATYLVLGENAEELNSVYEETVNSSSYYTIAYVETETSSILKIDNVYVYNLENNKNVTVNTMLSLPEISNVVQYNAWPNDVNATVSYTAPNLKIDLEGSSATGTKCSGTYSEACNNGGHIDWVTIDGSGNLYKRCTDLASQTTDANLRCVCSGYAPNKTCEYNYTTNLYNGPNGYSFDYSTCDSNPLIGNICSEGDDLNVACTVYWKWNGDYQPNYNCNGTMENVYEYWVVVQIN